MSLLISQEDIAGSYQFYGLYIIHQSLARYDTTITVVDDYDELNDQIWNFIYGRAFTSNGGIMDAFFLKIALGYHTYNYDATESFGAFYDIGDDFYADIGIRMFLFDLGGNLQFFHP